MRVIAGKHKAKKLDFPKSEQVRPTADMVKGALFTTLFDKVNGSRFLDLFCGSGQVGIEALSRGAAFAMFVDNNPLSIEVTKKNLVSITGNYQVIKTDFKKFLQTQTTAFDIIFLDPPYQSGFYEQALKQIFDGALLAENGIIVCEHNKQDNIEQSFFKVINTKNYGIKSLTYLTHQNND